MARALRVAGVVVPFALSIATAWTLGWVVPAGDGVVSALVRWLAIAAVTTFVLVGAERLARRLVPLRALLGLTLAFPDRAPSRVRLALRSASTAQLRRRVEEARSGAALDGPPEAAAERILELVMALSLHDRLTRGHAERVRALTELLAAELDLPADEVDRLRWAGLLHDIGKLLVPAEILNKPGRLTDAEFDVIKLHPEYGRTFVEPLVPWLGDAARAVWEHHEKFDGTGYPRRLAGTDISFAGRVVAVADCYDVMTSQRSYKAPVTPAEARAELARCAGTHFDPDVVRAFMRLSLGETATVSRASSWAGQVALLPQTLASAVSSGGVVATATLGLVSAGLGIGLADRVEAEDEPVATVTVEAPIDASDVAVAPTSPVDPSRSGTTPPAPAAPTAAAPSSTVDATAGATVAPPVVEAVAASTTSVPLVTPGPATTVRPGTTPATTTTTTVAPTAPTTTTAAPPVTVTTTTAAPVVTGPVVTVPSVTIPSITTPVVTTPVVTTPVLTTPQVTLTVPNVGGLLGG